MSKKILLCGIMSLGGVANVCDVQANTPANGPNPLPGCATPAQPGIQTANFPNPIMVPATLAVGGVIASVTTPIYHTASYPCIAGISNYWPSVNQITKFETLTGIKHVYATNIPGIGIAITTGVAYGVSDVNGHFYFPDSWQWYSPTNPRSENYQFGVYLIKTSAAVGTGTISSGIIAQRYINGNTPVARLQINTITVAPENPTCDFQAASVNVPLGEHQTSEFKGINTYTDWKPFSLVSSGCAAVTQQVRMTFTGTAVTGNANLFAVAGGATGVGVDLQSFDGIQAVPNGTTPMTWSPKAAGGTYDFQARYMQTANTVTTGNANANITVNLTYN